MWRRFVELPQLDVGPTSAGTTGAASGEIPDETAGPYSGDGSNGPEPRPERHPAKCRAVELHEMSGTAEGVPMEPTLGITDRANGGAFAGGAVYVWHCDRAGAGGSTPDS